MPKKEEIKSYPRSYKLEPHIMEILISTLKRANKLRPKKISEARLIKALIILSKDTSDSQLSDALKEVG